MHSVAVTHEMTSQNPQSNSPAGVARPLPPYSRPPQRLSLIMAFIRTARPRARLNHAYRPCGVWPRCGSDLLFSSQIPLCSVWVWAIERPPYMSSSEPSASRQPSIRDPSNLSFKGARRAPLRQPARVHTPPTLGAVRAFAHTMHVALRFPRQPLMLSGGSISLTGRPPVSAPRECRAPSCIIGNTSGFFFPSLEPLLTYRWHKG
jgi:hypothetical protein